MYRADNFMGGAFVKGRSDFHHLAECIRRGGKLRPKKGSSQNLPDILR
jgi:hypothetical protein